MPEKVAPDSIDTAEECEDCEEFNALRLSVTANTVAVHTLTLTLERVIVWLQRALLTMLTAICIGYSLMLVLP